MNNTIKLTSEPIGSEEKTRFLSLCEEDESAIPPESTGIGTCNEKRTHRVVKKYVCEQEECLEVKVGKYVADVLCDGMITEIQTAGFSSLNAKIKFYLENTDFKVTVIHPMIADKKLIRADRESGELISAKISPKHATPIDVLPELMYVSEFIGNARFEVKLFMLRADEYRYSERVRYRKSGAYDHDLIPRELIEVYAIRSANDVRDVVPAGLRNAPHRAAELEKLLGCKGRKLYRAITCLINLGILKKVSEGKKTVKYYYESPKTEL